MMRVGDEGRSGAFVESIKQKPSLLGAAALPDFRNLGVLLRLLLLVNALGLATALVRNERWAQLPTTVLELAARVELPLLSMACVLYLFAPWLRRLPVLSASVLLFVLVAVVVLALELVGTGNADSLAELLWAWAACALTLAYFRCRQQRLSPALAEARLQALTARIRPHFLFNSLNAVLGVIRSDPRRAERVLEELAELFRMLMRDHRELVSLADELRLCEGYLAVENLRLGERLQVRWVLPLAGSVEHQALLAVQVPALLLQPLLENAVYHGIEPVSEAGEIIVHATRDGEQLLLEVDNPLAASAAAHPGNRMALDNIRERLMLFFDLEARLEIELREGRHRVRIRLPWRTKNLQTGQQSREEA